MKQNELDVVIVAAFRDAAARLPEHFIERRGGGQLFAHLHDETGGEFALQRRGTVVDKRRFITAKVLRIF